MTQKQENPFGNILFNLVLPVLILNYSHKAWPQIHPAATLILALSFPIGYGIMDYFKNDRHKNILSILGVINVVFTGGLALFSLKGFWFAVKEAAFPLVIGLWCLGSAWTKKPLMNWIVYKSSLFQTSVIEKQTAAKNKEQELKGILKKSTIYFSLCFFFSAVLNFILALNIFQDTGEGSSPQILNEKIADMTWISFLVIGLPMTAASAAALWWFIVRLKKITGLPLEQLIHTEKQHAKKL